MIFNKKMQNNQKEVSHVICTPTVHIGSPSDEFCL